MKSLNLRGGFKKIVNQFWVEDGNKRRFNFKWLGLLLLPLVFIGAWLSIFLEKKDTSYISQGTPEVSVEVQSVSSLPEEINNSRNRLVREASTSVPAKRSGIKIRYAAKQVIDRHVESSARYMPAGSNLIGKLLTAIDTRDQSQMIKVLLPYGGVYQGSRRIERNSMLMGTAQYGGKGEKVFLRLNKMIDPDGNEYSIQAQALSSKDYSSGLIGEVHSNMDSRMVAAVGLSMLSAGSDVLIEREALGESFSATPKSNMKNAALAGVSRATQMEAERRASNLSSEEPYVTVEAGVELIVSLTESFKGEINYGN